MIVFFLFPISSNYLFLGYLVKSYLFIQICICTLLFYRSFNVSYFREQSMMSIRHISHTIVVLLLMLTLFRPSFHSNSFFTTNEISLSHLTLHTAETPYPNSTLKLILHTNKILLHYSQPYSLSPHRPT